MRRNICYFCISIFWILQLASASLFPVTKSKAQIYFKYFHLPIKQNVTSIKLFKSSRMIAVAQNLFYFDGKDWKYDLQKTENAEVTTIAGRDINHLFVVKRLYPLNYSQLFYLDGKNYKRVHHPFGNEIITLDVDNEGTLWIGGDREIARKKNKIWQFIQYPPSQYSVQKICAIHSDLVWVRMFDGKLFFFNGVKWARVLNTENVRSITLMDKDKILVQTENKLYEINNQQIKFITENAELRMVESVDARNTNAIFCATNKGHFFYYDGKEWKKSELSYKENINSIVVTGIDEGYLACDGGTIIKFSRKEMESNEFSDYGFYRIKPIQYAKNIDDEYGVGIADLNNDGVQDVYTVCLYDPNRLYLNGGLPFKTSTNTFTERAGERRATGREESEILGRNISKIQLGVGLADVNNDGAEDIYITSLYGKNKLLINDGTGFFRDVSLQKERATNTGDRSNSVIFSDVNNDGWIDIFLVNEFSSNRLFINKTNGYFREVTKGSGLESIGGSNGAVFADADNDGFQDLFVCNWGRKNDFYKNVSSKDKIKFLKQPFPTDRSNQETEKNNGAVFFDYNNDGLLDLFVTNRGFSNHLYKNLGNMKFKDVTKQTIGLDSLLSYSATAADFDNDGFQDLFVSNVGKSILYKNVEGNKFVDVSDLYGALTEGYCTGTSSADIDNDGDMDLYVACYVNGGSKLLVNKTDNKNYFLLNIEGTISNRNAIGVKIFLYDQANKHLVGFKEISGGAGYSSINSKQVHFGAIKDHLYKIKIYFPASKKTITLENLKRGQIINVSEETGVARRRTILAKRFYALIQDPEIQIEGFKLFCVLVLLAISLYKGKRKYEWRFKRNFLAHMFLLLVYAMETAALFYHEFILSTFLPLVSVIVGVVLIHLVYQRIILVIRIKEERKKTRDSIARDIHDDLASTISSGLIYADALQRKMQADNDQQKNLAQNISSLLVEASETINDLVWTVSPSHDSLQDLVARMRFFVSNTCENNNIEYDINVEINEPNKILSDEVKKNIFLIYKEAMQNIIKHSFATKVRFSIIQHGDEVEIIISDNGLGFDEQNIKTENMLHGNGLNNLKKRGAEIAALVSVNSFVGKGTEIKSKIKMI